MKNSFAFLLIFLFSAIGNLYSQTELTLADIFKNGTYRQNRFGPIRWMKDGTGYSSIEKNPLLEGDDMVRYDAAKGTRSILISAEELTPTGVSKPLSVADYHWSEDNSKLLIFTNTRKVWRYHTRGDYWVLDIIDESCNEFTWVTGSSPKKYQIMKSFLFSWEREIPLSIYRFVPIKTQSCFDTDTGWSGEQSDPFERN